MAVVEEQVHHRAQLHLEWNQKKMQTCRVLPQNHTDRNRRQCSSSLVSEKTVYKVDNINIILFYIEGSL
jgi:hypothetical protein